MQEYERRWLHSNQSVRVGMPDCEVEGHSASERSAVIKGLSASGFPTSPAPPHFSPVCNLTCGAGFIVADMQGERVELHPDMTSMDLTQRLLYAKRL